jgi:hypothetical protein
MRFRRRVNDCSQPIQGDPRLIQSQLIEYIIYLRENRKLGSNSINTNIAAVKKFYDTNDIELKWQKSSLMLVREMEEDEVENTDLTPSRRFQRC